MSGHNKWSKIKNVKAKNEAQTSKLYTKIGREIAVAVKSGGADPNSNAKLKNIIMITIFDVLRHCVYCIIKEIV